jgi:DNA-binding NtrC family response regulator
VDLRFTNDDAESLKRYDWPGNVRELQNVIERAMILAKGERLRLDVAMAYSSNASLKIPSIHPIIGIYSFPAVNHQPEFTAYCISPVADQALADGALAMAYTVVDVSQDVDLRKRLMAARGA